jgi:hypothetical protein
MTKAAKRRQSQSTFKSFKSTDKRRKSKKFAVAELQLFGNMSHSFDSSLSSDSYIPGPSRVKRLKKITDSSVAKMGR